MLRWYVLHATTGTEEDLRTRLDHMAYPAMLPRKIMRERRGGQSHDVTRIMLPGYVFVETAMTAADWHRIRRLPGVLRILGSERPAPLPEDEAARIAWLDNGGEPWGVSVAEASEEGADYVIKSGPLAEYRDEIISIDRRGNRARIRASVLGETKTINLALVFEDTESPAESD